MPLAPEAEKDIVTREGRHLRLRPIGDDDDDEMIEMARRSTPEDLRLRFFTPMHGLSHELAARLTQIDYDREMALVAQADGGGSVLGIARYFADPDRLRAEYAIAVRSDWQGRGVGYLLMTRLIAVARHYGVGELAGEVLRENRPMLEMCRELGFAAAADPRDPSIVQVRKPLG